MLIGDRCYFCLNKKAEHVIVEGNDRIHLCNGCNDQYQEVIQNTEEKSILAIPHKNPSDLCRRCGLCCVMLCAKVDKDEAQKFLDQARDSNIYPQDITFEQFCTLQDTKPYEGEYTINMPCRYLQGSILKYVGCRAYHLVRPKVCPSYLCKIAVEYKVGRITLDQARFSLRQAFMEGDVGIFNWSNSLENREGYETRISLLSKISDLVKELREAEMDEQMIEFALAAQITPDYIPSSDVSRTLFSMHMFNVDRGDFNLELYIPEMVGLSGEEKTLAENVIRAVLTDLRKLFIRADEIGGKPKEEQDENK